MTRISSFGMNLDDVLKDFTNCVGKSNFAKVMILKGGMNLKVILSRQGNRDFRRTIDIDFHVKDVEVWERFIEEIPTTISSLSDKKITYTVRSRRSKKGTIFLGDNLEIIANDDVRFEIDMNLGEYDPGLEKKVYVELDGFSLGTVLADKIKVFLSQKIYRRSKDFYDLYLIATMRDIRLIEIFGDLEHKWESTGGPEIPLHIPDVDKLSHAYSKLVGLRYNPTFEEAYAVVMDFVLPLVKFMGSESRDDLMWDSSFKGWTEC